MGGAVMRSEDGPHSFYWGWWSGQLYHKDSKQWSDLELFTILQLLGVPFQSFQ